MEGLGKMRSVKNFIVSVTLGGFLWMPTPAWGHELEQAHIIPSRVQPTPEGRILVHHFPPLRVSLETCEEEAVALRDAMVQAEEAEAAALEIADYTGGSYARCWNEAVDHTHSPTIVNVTVSCEVALESGQSLADAIDACL